jgi:prevent-host-death family protein
MSLQKDIRPVTYLKSRAADLLAQVNETRRPVVITQNGEPKGVLQDPATYERTRAALGMLKLLAQGEEDVRAGRTLPQREVFRAARRRLAERSRERERA